MGTFATMKTGVALRVHDSGQTEITDANYGVLVNQAVDDLNAESIVLPLAEDESTTLVALTWKYDVPASFAYIKELREESAAASGKYPTAIHPTLWRVSIETGATPQIIFDENEYTLTAGLHIKVIGQKRVPQLTGTDTVPIGLEAFIRERAVAYAAGYVAGGLSELAAHRRVISDQAWQRSLELLSRIPREYRPLPDSKRVPER